MKEVGPFEKLESEYSVTQGHIAVKWNPQPHSCADIKISLVFLILFEMRKIQNAQTVNDFICGITTSYPIKSCNSFSLLFALQFHSLSLIIFGVKIVCILPK
jgi:hypothetical protein